MKKLKALIALLLMLTSVVTVSAQRVIDNLDRGIVAVKTTSGVYVSWRIQSDEYYDVTYNLYRNGTLIAENLQTSNYTDAAGSTSNTYTVAPVVNGVVKEQSQPVAVWAQDYLEIAPQHPSGLKATYIPNDACCADVDGDGEVEILMKFDNQQEMSNSFPKNGWFKEHTIFEVLKLDGTLLWWADCGPNMGDFQNNEQNIVGYDWDMDGKAEALMRLAEGSTIHMSDGSTYVIGADGQNGTSWTNYRTQNSVSVYGATAAVETGLSESAVVSCSASWVTTSVVDGVLYATAEKNETSSWRSTQIKVTDNGTTSSFTFGQTYLNSSGKEVYSQFFTPYGNEFLVYCNGATGQIYDLIDFPCARYESGETDLNKAWGDGYGHRSSKYFYGAPYLDGRKPSIFVGRGIYTRHKFVALDVDQNTHKLSERWRWTNNQAGSPWYGQGYHNYAIVDVDWDGRDEIVFGGLVIDDNGKGLSTVGLGHGDAQHHGDLNPFIHGSEGWFCNEDAPNNHYRDLTTAKLYYRNTSSSDDGRAIAGNFSNSIPGCVAASSHDSASPISLVANQHIDGYTTDGMSQNFNCYWDGDLCEETFNGVNGKNSAGGIYKFGSWSAIKTLTGSLTNNDTKATPSYKGDILGDWREEFIMRTSDNNIRIYTTTTETPWRNYSLWYDHQYRNGMVWQMCGYNQPAHTSYFLGELEGITAAPPSLTMQGRSEVANGGTINNNGESVITCETNDMTVAVADGATPYIYIDNAPSWVQGSAPSEATAAEYTITYKYYTHTLTGGAFAGDMRLVKQGDGALTLPDVVQTYKGQTDVWAGTLNFNGTLQNSRLWLNRFAELNSDGGVFSNGIKAQYASIIRPGGLEAKASSITTDSLILDYGAVVEIDLYSDNLAADTLNAAVLKIYTKNWENGPEYNTPVFRVNAHPATGATAIADGKYYMGAVTEVVGSLDDILIENLTGQKAVLSVEDGKMYMTVTNYVSEPVTWKGDKSSEWDLDKTANFVNEDGEEKNFVSGSDVTFNDNASSFDVTVSGNVTPNTISFLNKKQYTLDGNKILGTPELFKDSVGVVYINNVNDMGDTNINGGTLYAASMANEIGVEYGSLGTVDKQIYLTNGGALGASASLTNGQIITCGTGNGVITTPSGVTFTQAANIRTANGGALIKTGAGTLNVTGNMAANGVTVKEGTYVYDGTANTRKVTLQGTSTISGGGLLTSPVQVDKGASVTWNLPKANYTSVSGKVTGSGTITVNTTNTANRNRITGNWSAFTGTVNYTNTSYRMPIKNSYGLPNGTLNIGSGARVAASGLTYTIGKLTGKGILEHAVSDFNSQTVPTASNTWKVGNSSDDLGDFQFDGYLYDAAGTSKANFVKVGTCKMTLGTAWQNSGTVKVSEGELHLNQKVTLGTGALTVDAGALLTATSGSSRGIAKNFTMTNSSLTVNGTLWPSSSESSVASCYLAIGSCPVKFSSQATLKVGLKKCATASIAYNTCLLGDGSASKVEFADGATIEAYTLDYEPTFVSEEVTDSFKVLMDVPYITGTALNYNLPSLPQNYYWKNRWDNTLFAKTGCLYVGYVELIGDANRDGSVTMADANMVVNYFLTGSADGISLPHADVNGDGLITMADANAIVNIFLTGNAE